ncbi:MAG: transposase, partial [Phycisphaerales bacterium]|nr:transposase [Phycisphaerales bacterium]
MVPYKKNNAQIGFFSSFEDPLSHKHPLYILANKIKWQQFETAFLPLYCPDNGRRAKPIRLMVGLLILKHLRNISDESVVGQWSENSYYQYFCGETSFVPTVPCEASELVHFRNRIGIEGIELIFKESIRINGDEGKEDKIRVDTTVQEKNITYPAVIKQYENIFGKAPKEITTDRGYRGKNQINETTINIPKTFNQLSAYRQKNLRHQFRRRAAIEPVIGHLKTDHLLSHNFYKGIKGDEMNVLLSAAAFNFKRMINKWKKFFLCLIQNLVLYLQ